MKIKVKDNTYDNGPIIVYKGGELTLSMYTRSGRFNLMSNEESLSCNISVFEDGKKLMSCNTAPTYEKQGTYSEDALEEILEDLGRYWIDTARDDKKRMYSFIKRYQEKIDHGNDVQRIKQIESQITTLFEEREMIKKRLQYA